MLAETAQGLEQIGIFSGVLIGFEIAKKAAARIRNNGPTSRPGEAPTCRAHGEALAAGKERFAHLQESVDRLHDKVDRLLEQRP